MQIRIVALVLLALALFMWGCPKDEEEQPAPTPPTSDNASGSVRSDTSGVITTPAGARIAVPVGAVPRTDQGNVGTMVFSIERDNSALVTPPSGETVATDVYRFGPEGFVFSRPVSVTIPVLDAPNQTDIQMYRMNPTTGEAERYSAVYDTVNHTLTAQTYEFSLWFGSSRPAVNTANGCVHMVNNSIHWLVMCVDSFDLTFPSIDGPYMASYGNGGMWAPPGNIGFANESQFFMPQGTFWVCLRYHIDDGFGAYHYVHDTASIVIANAWNYWDSPVCSDEIITSGPSANADTGECVCIPMPTTSVGTGDIQVTLSWYHTAPGVDLDLWVMDPDSEWCGWSNLTTASGGELDRDNKCSNYENGRPENIYWTAAPPAGQYIVAVDWWSACGDAVASLPFNVRTVVRGTTQTFSQTIPEGADMQEVTRFTISGGLIVFEPPRKDATWMNLSKRPKIKM